MSHRTDQRGRTHSNLLVLLGIGGLLLFALGTHSCLFRGFGLDVFGNPLARGWGFSPYSLLGLGGLLQVGLAIWVGYDAHRRGLNGVLWGLLVLFTFIVGLIVYLLVGSSMAGGGAWGSGWAARAGIAGPAADSVAPPGQEAGRQAPEPRCPKCAEPIRPDFKVCPYCASTLRCRDCDEPLQSGWRVCPQCGTPAEADPA